jgi:hypothetical protein
MLTEDLPEKKFTKFERWQTILRAVQAGVGVCTLLAAIWIGLKQTSINQSLYEMHFTPSIAVVWNQEEKRLRIVNTGKENIWLWGTRFGNEQKVLEKEARLITPGTYYYFFAEHIEQEILAKVPPDKDQMIDFAIYIKDGAGRPHTAKVILLVRVSGGKVKIHTQTTAIDQTQW